MFELLIPVAAVSTLGWALFSALRGNRPVAAGAAVMGLLLTCAWAAGGTSPWSDGGPEMNVLALTGTYGLGAATAFRLSGGRGAKFAAIIAASLTALLAGAFYLNGMQELDALLRSASDPGVAESIKEGSRVELVRLLQLGSALVVTTVLLLVKQPGGGSQSRQSFHDAIPVR